MRAQERPRAEKQLQVLDKEPSVPKYLPRYKRIMGLGIFACVPNGSGAP